MKQALGLAVGDIVLTEYGSGPYEIVDLSAPTYYEIGSFTIAVHNDWLCTSLSLKLAPGHHLYGTGRDKTDYGSSHIWRDDGDRWYDDVNCELYRLKKGTFSYQETLFAPIPVPWRFAPGVDYGNEVWNCSSHGDYNCEPRNGCTGPCPVCGHSWKQRQVFVIPPRDPARRQWGVYWITTHRGRPLDSDGPDYETAIDHAIKTNCAKVMALLVETGQTKGYHL